jgi:hypothetical protein
MENDKQLYHLAFEKYNGSDEARVVIHATNISVDDLVNLGRLLGVIKN